MYIRGGDDYRDDRECPKCWSIFEDVQTRLLQPISFIWLHAEPILLSLKQDPEVAQLAAVYLRWSALGLPGSLFLSTTLL